MAGDARTRAGRAGGAEARAAPEESDHQVDTVRRQVRRLLCDDQRDGRVRNGLRSRPLRADLRLFTG